MAANRVKLCPDCGTKYKMVFGEVSAYWQCPNCGDCLQLTEMRDYDGHGSED